MSAPAPHKTCIISYSISLQDKFRDAVPVSKLRPYVLQLPSTSLLYELLCKFYSAYHCYAMFVCVRRPAKFVIMMHLQAHPHCLLVTLTQRKMLTACCLMLRNAYRETSDVFRIEGVS